MKMKHLLTALAAFCLIGTAMADPPVERKAEISWAMETGNFDHAISETKVAIAEEAETLGQLVILTGGGKGKGKGAPRYTLFRGSGKHKCGAFGRANNCVAQWNGRFATCVCVSGAAAPRGRGHGRRQRDL
jgi:hypothetical protein